jgi:hypothetical protein
MPASKASTGRGEVLPWRGGAIPPPSREVKVLPYNLDRPSLVIPLAVSSGKTQERLYISRPI